MMRKSQITVFILIGMVVAVAFGTTYYTVQTIAKAKIEQQAKQITQELLQTTAIEYYVTLCMEKVTSDGLWLLGRQGGKLYDYQGGDIYYLGPPYILPFGGRHNVSYGITKPRVQETELYGWYPTPPGYFSEAPGYFAEDKLPALCDPSGPNRIGMLSALHRQCESYGFNSIQKQLNNFIEKNIVKCVNFSSFASELGYNITEGKVSSNVTLGETDLMLSVVYPIFINIGEQEQLVRFLDFKSTLNVRLKKLHEFAKHLIELDKLDPSFDIVKDANKTYYWLPGFDVVKYKNICPQCIIGKYDDIFLIKDSVSLLDGKEYYFQFGIKNRWPALDWLHETYETSQYDLFFIENDTINLAPMAYDPDEETNLVYNYSGWKETWDEYFDFDCYDFLSDANSIEHPEICIKKINTEPHNWTNSTQFKQTRKNASYELTHDDIGPHNVTITVYDEEGLKDWQVVRIFVLDHPEINIQSSNEYEDIGNFHASVEDAYTIDATPSAIWSTVSAFIWEDLLGTGAANPMYSTTEPILRLPKIANISNITMEQFKDVQTHTIHVTISHDGFLTPPVPYTVEVHQCLPHTSLIPSYPYSTGDAFQANHTCCDDYLYSPNTKECYRTEQFGCFPDPTQEKYPATLAVTAQPDGRLSDAETLSVLPKIYDATNTDVTNTITTSTLTLNNIENDIFKRVYSQKCSGNRGNACAGYATDEWKVVKTCKDLQQGEQERCQGPAQTQSQCSSLNENSECYNYNRGETFENTFLGAGTGICNSNAICSDPDSGNGYGKGVLKLHLCMATCDGQGNCDATRAEECTCSNLCGASCESMTDCKAVSGCSDHEQFTDIKGNVFYKREYCSGATPYELVTSYSCVFSVCGCVVSHKCVDSDYNKQACEADCTNTNNVWLSTATAGLSGQKKYCCGDDGSLDTWGNDEDRCCCKGAAIDDGEFCDGIGYCIDGKYETNVFFGQDGEPQKGCELGWPCNTDTDAGREGVCVLQEQNILCISNVCLGPSDTQYKPYANCIDGSQCGYFNTAGVFVREGYVITSVCCKDNEAQCQFNSQCSTDQICQACACIQKTVP